MGKAFNSILKEICKGRFVMRKTSLATLILLMLMVMFGMSGGSVLAQEPSEKNPPAQNDSTVSTEQSNSQFDTASSNYPFPGSGLLWRQMIEKRYGTNRATFAHSYWTSRYECDPDPDIDYVFLFYLDYSKNPDGLSSTLSIGSPTSYIF